MEPVYLAALTVPVLIQLYSKRAARIVLALTLSALIALGVTSSTPQFGQVFILASAVIILADSSSDPRLLSLVALVGVAPLQANLQLGALVLLLVVTMAARGSHGRMALYALFTLVLTLILDYLGYTFASLSLVLLLVGAPPFHKSSCELYKHYRGATILVALVAVLNVNAQVGSFAPVAPLCAVFGVIMMMVGVFTGMKTQTFSGLFSSIHQIAFGLLLAAASSRELDTLFIYLLLPAVLSLAATLRVYGGLPEKSKGLLEFGGLSTSMRVESASVLLAGLILFTAVSMGAEVFMRIGLGGDAMSVALGCVTLVAAAASLAVIYRGYSLVFEGVGGGFISTKDPQQIISAALSCIGAVVALFPTWTIGAFSSLGASPTSTIESMNTLLVLTFVAAAIAFALSLGVKPGKTKSWTTGYARAGEIQGARGEVFTSWQEIFAPLYKIMVPDEDASEAVGKMNPLLVVAVIAVLVALEVLLWM